MILQRYFWFMSSNPNFSLKFFAWLPLKKNETELRLTKKFWNMYVQKIF